MKHFLRYVHPTIREPFPDLLNLAVPAELEDQPLAALGYVDVTQGTVPGRSHRQDGFDRGHSGRRRLRPRSPDGVLLPAGHLPALRHADLHPAALPAGQRPGLRRQPLSQHARRLASRAAASALVLRTASPGFGDPAKPKIFVHFWSRGYPNPTTADRVTDGLPPEVEQPNIGMNQMLVNLDVVIGEGNPGAIAVRHQAAEGSAIEDCTIDATHGLTGIQGGIGSGGSSAGVTVIGGRVGLDFTGYLSGTQPTPVITGFTLDGPDRGGDPQHEPADAGGGRPEDRRRPLRRAVDPGRRKACRPTTAS